MSSFEFKGSTKEEAIELGLKQLNLTVDEVEVEVKHYGGLLSKATVLLTPKIVQNAECRMQNDGSINLDDADANHQSPSTNNQLTEEELEEKFEKAVIFFSGLLSKMEVNADMDAKIVDGEIKIAVNGPDAPALIGHRGEILDALQYFTHTVVNENEKRFARIHVDSHGYRGRRKESLEQLADKMARRASKSGRMVELEPMNPADRRTIHTVLQNDRFVTTESRGEGRDRHIVIIPKQRDRKPRDNNGYQPRERDSSFQQRDSYAQREERAPRQERSDAPQEITYGSSNFNKKGPSRTRSFGASKRKF
jgi:spoIIIJ-associated protein